MFDLQSATTLTSGGDPARACWWHVTEVTLDHLRASPEWQKQMEALELAKEQEELIRKGQRELAAQRRQEEEMHRLLRVAADEIKARFTGR